VCCLAMYSERSGDMSNTIPLFGTSSYLSFEVLFGYVFCTTVDNYSKIQQPRSIISKKYPDDQLAPHKSPDCSYR
jgi:hypothetical protein